jgi:DNA polymerase III alpha subunit
VATNDVHYLNADDWTAQDVLLCIGTGSLVSQPSRMRMTDHSYYMKSDQEMAALFGAEAPESLVTPLAIAEMCNVNSIRGLPPARFPCQKAIPESFCEAVEVDQKPPWARQTSQRPMARLRVRHSPDGL